MERKGAALCGTAPRTGETLSTGTPFFPPVWAQGMEPDECLPVCTRVGAPGFMQRPLKIPFLFPSQKKERKSPKKGCFYVSCFTRMSLFDSSCSRRHGELPKKSFDHGKLSCTTHLNTSQGPPPLLPISFDHSIVAAGLRNPTQLASKANSLAFGFLLQSFKG